jgi:hypothetical protein
MLWPRTLPSPLPSLLYFSQSILVEYHMVCPSLCSPGLEGYSLLL